MKKNGGGKSHATVPVNIKTGVYISAKKPYSPPPLKDDIFSPTKHYNLLLAPFLALFLPLLNLVVLTSISPLSFVFSPFSFTISSFFSSRFSYFFLQLISVDIPQVSNILWRACNLTAFIHSSNCPVVHPFASCHEGPYINPQGGTYVKSGLFC
jgi:hypothetical protein